MREIEPLTAKQKDILEMLADGRTSPWIAEELVIGKSTVRSHIKDIRRKLNCHTIAHCVAIAIRNGIID